MAEPERDALKRAAAARAVAEVQDGMVIGLGSGSTAEIALALLAERRLRITGVPSSERTARRARALGLALASPDDHPALDLALDGADQVERGTLNLIKGLGGALLREKIVASLARRLIVMVDHGKLVDRLGGIVLPVEIVTWGWHSTLARLESIGLKAGLRGGTERPFVTDGGNLVADGAVGAIDDARSLDARLKTVAGVIETGLFLGLAARVIVAGPGGVEVLDRCAR
jgi:ribose 5-phosphate isomerase A